MWKAGGGKENVAIMDKHSGSIPLNINHVHCDVMTSKGDGKARRLLRTGSAVSDNFMSKASTSTLKEIRKQNSVSDIFSVIVNRGRDRINRKLISSSRPNSQSQSQPLVQRPFQPREGFANIQESRRVMERSKEITQNVFPMKHCERFSSVLTDNFNAGQISTSDHTKLRIQVAEIKPQLNPIFHKIQSGQIKFQDRKCEISRPPNKLMTRQQSIDFPLVLDAPHHCSRYPYIIPRSECETKGHLTHILNYLYVGGIEGAYNESVLCKANINALVDIANVPANFSVPGRTLACPCFCVSKIHFRSKLYISVDDIEWESMESYFEEINNFIEGARKCQKNVLIFSYHGKSRSAAAAIQYLMNIFKISLDLAYRTVKCRRPEIVINQGLWKALERLDKNINESENALAVIQSNKLTPKIPPKIRNAWQDG